MPRWTRRIGGTPPQPPGSNEVEPNNTRATSQLVATDNTTINGTMSSSSDTDYYRMTLAGGWHADGDADAERVVGLRPVRLQQQRRR